MAESKIDKSGETASSPASSPDDLIKDLDVKLTEEEQRSIVGGRKAGGDPQENLKIAIKDPFIT